MKEQLRYAHPNRFDIPNTYHISSYVTRYRGTKNDDDEDKNVDEEAEY